MVILAFTHGRDAPTGVRTLAGVLSGGGLGFAVGGIPGSVFGGIAGLIIGFSSDMMERRED